MEFSFSAAEEAVFKEIERRMHAGDWSDRVTVKELLEDWRTFSAEVDSYGLTIENYSNDLWVRDGLEYALNECDEPLSTKLKLAIAEADNDFLARTEADLEQRLGRHCHLNEGWWWKRRPKAGPMAEFLASSLKA